MLPADRPPCRTDHRATHQPPGTHPPAILLEGAAQGVRGGPGRRRSRPGHRARGDRRGPRAERCGQVHHHRDDHRSDRPGRRDGSRCSAVRRAQAVRQGLVGVMLQAGALLHEATVNDVLATDAGTARAPAVAGGGDRAGGSRLVPEDQDREAVRWPGPAAAVRAGDHGGPPAVDPGRADGRHGRGDPARLLGVHAGVHRRRSDGAVRHPLPGRGRRRGGPDRGPGPRSADRRRHPVHDQEPGRRSDDHAGGSRGQPRRAHRAAGRDRRPSGAVAGCCCAPPTPTPRCGR